MSKYLRVSVDGVRLREHVAVAQRALGKPLPPGALVHHANEDRHDNRPENLVICPDRGYHALIHRRIRALAACGDPAWRPCTLCRKYDAPENMKRQGNRLGGEMYAHAECHASYMRDYRANSPAYKANRARLRTG